MWDHFVAELVAVLFTWGVLLGGAILAHAFTFLAGVGYGRRTAWESVDATQAGYDEQIDITVRMLSAAAKEDR
jgi:hypothetical protein